MNSDTQKGFRVEDLKAYFGKVEALHGISMAIPFQQVTAIIGPSGCGKSTFVRCLNRMHEVTPETKVTGVCLWQGWDLYGPAVDPVEVRRRIGMVFQKANPFPMMSIYDNVVAGLKLMGVRNKQKLAQTAEQSLLRAALWDEVKDKLGQPGTSLSGGQQQRLCIARALAVEPEVLLLDEPTSALDPIAARKVEELIYDLKQSYTIVIVTHNMQQAARVSDRTAFFLLGELIEYDKTALIFTNPREKRTEDYITGRFG